MMYIIRDKI